MGRGRVVVLRGLANVFSTGMDRLAARLAAAGYRVELGNHLEWQAAAGRLVAAERSSRLPRPVAVIGHSLGADDAIRLAGTAGEAGVATDLLVTFDPVWVSRVSTGPRRVLNFYLAVGIWGRSLGAAPGFTGTIENVDVGPLGVTHFDIEKSAALHARVLATLEQEGAPTAPQASVAGPECLAPGGDPMLPQEAEQRSVHRIPAVGPGGSHPTMREARPGGPIWAKATASPSRTVMRRLSEASAMVAPPVRPAGGDAGAHRVAGQRSTMRASTRGPGRRR